MELDEREKRIKAIRKSFAEKDLSDAKKLEILGKSVGDTATFMDDGTKYLQDQMKIVTDKNWNT